MQFEKNVQVKQPKYQQIAVDLASKIVERKYRIGDKIYARSSLASQYNVSSETARRAIAVLQDLEIVEATKGSGVIIISYEKAASFVRQFQDVQSVHELQHELMTSIQKQHQELINLQDKTKQLISRTEHFRSVNPFIPYQLEMTAESPCIQQTVQELNFWQNTSSTIVGIRRKNELLLSPGPYVSLEEGDIVYFIGNDESFARVQSFLYPN
ncbi:GntR family transcriptional regulator [Lysinibacillus sphaericus]|uniref:TrkA C-terminal domain-containing protein n=1 Tax=Lysinibacillus sphaericus TaxID=1421 RepID=UPI0018CDEA73|nr:TrkA C-terminal domain-containing protein [Lysinibacillus sphaericus]MBG9456553.1 GntR family transcriptional regulator [Lysinibacillus sphaericus]MBG9479953.1 GntR family transcriptional regulator [Lysinibacillus sphaericus]MBG9594701.1 GntR family transcriptional regulator [Lysinibacillus sphaericus]